MTVLFNIWTQDWFQTIIGAVAVGLAALIGLAFNKLIKFLEQKGLDTKYARVLASVSKLIQDAVLMVNQTFVSQLKKDGTFLPEKQKEALVLATEAVVANLTEEARTVLSEVYGDVNAWIIVQIEAIINKMLPHKN